ncbi:MAG TPA: GntR family transcriptional regulator [Ruminiclostridium sp.]|nr:GntR family transcriptional regulator [Ruminiclostridium sp.]
MHILISNKSGVPIYEQIELQISELIMKGELKEGDVLPSIRQLARDLRISVITTARAYSELEGKGFLAAMQGKGYYVLSGNSAAVKEQYLQKVSEHLENAVKDAKTAGIPQTKLIEILKGMFKEENEND